MTEQTGDEFPPPSSRVRVEVAIAELRGMLSTVVAQHNARLDENARQIADLRADHSKLDTRVDVIERSQIAATARDGRDDENRSFRFTKSQIFAGWAMVLVTMLGASLSAFLALVHHP